MIFSTVHSIVLLSVLFIGGHASSDGPVEYPMKGDFGLRSKVTKHGYGYTYRPEFHAEYNELQKDIKQYRNYHENKMTARLQGVSDAELDKLRFDNANDALRYKSGTHSIQHADKRIRDSSQSAESKIVDQRILVRISGKLTEMQTRQRAEERALMKESLMRQGNGGGRRTQ